MKKEIFSIFLLLMACAPSSDELAKRYQAEVVYTGELMDKDYEFVAKKMITDALSNEFEKPKPGGGRWVLGIGEIRNNTKQRLSPSDITAKFRIAFQRSGKMAVTNLGENQDIVKSRDLAESSLMNKATTMKKGTVIAADVSMHGSIGQKDIKLDGDKYLVEYVFNLILTDLNSGLQLWEGQIPVKKIITKDMITW